MSGDKSCLWKKIFFFYLVMWNLCSVLTINAANIGQLSVLQDVEKQTCRLKDSPGSAVEHN